MRLVKTFGRRAKDTASLIETLERRGTVNTARVEPVVRRILGEVRKNGDTALRQYATKLDGLRKDSPLLVTNEEMKAAWDATSPHLQAAMMVARGNILAFAEAQLPQEWMISPAAGVTTGQIIRPLGSVGCYVPGGRYPLPSTLLMTVTPAQVAGIERIVVCSPNPAKETLAAAWLAGPTEFYRVGGAQAVAAMAYGTASVERVNKIVGPGNLYVTAAKILASNDCGIDMPAGPTEIVVTSETGSATEVAADLVAQAEHDPEALGMLITSNEALAKNVAAAVKLQTRGNVIAKQSLAANGFALITATVREAQELTNRLAPEHLTVDTANDLTWVSNAGSVFVGKYTPQSMGDYVSGPNHVLPTGRFARIRGGLSVMDFVKVITVQKYTHRGLKQMGPHAIALAEAEGLIGHMESVRVRMESF